jgi:hypothetical protein
MLVLSFAYCVHGEVTDFQDGPKIRMNAPRQVQVLSRSDPCQLVSTKSVVQGSICGSQD